MIFYRNPDGKEVKSFSYSQGSALAFCPRKYIYERHYGWTEWPPAASREFGKAVEAGVRAFYQNGTAEAQGVAEKAFEAEWEKSKERPLEYKKDEKDWETLRTMGRHFMALLAGRAPQLGIRQPTFYDWKTRISKPFVGDSELVAIPDAVDWPEPHPKWGGGARIVDIKTSGSAYRSEPEGICAMDEQLRTYAWATGLQRVAFLVFVKGNPTPAIKKGSTYTLLEESCGLPAGTEVSCVSGGKASCEVVPAHDSDGAPTPCLPGELTACRIQLIEGRIDPLEAQATVESLAAEAELAAKRWELFSGPSGFSEDEALAHAYPQKGGMRFPNEKCSWCPMLGLCLKDDALVKERIIKSADAWMEEWE